MMIQDSQDDIYASRLFKEILSPCLDAGDVREIVQGSRCISTAYTFVVNPKAAQNLCVQLEPHTFTALSSSMQFRILTLMDVGLGCGICSAVRLRLGCESNPQSRSLLWRLLDLLEVAVVNLEDDTRGALSRIIRAVCCTGIELNELKRVLGKLRIPSAQTRPLLVALGATVRGVDDRGRADRELSGASQTIGSFFNFDGIGSGLLLPDISWPFAHEYQVVFWLRIEQWTRWCTEIADKTTTGRRAHLATFATNAGAGVDYYLEVCFPLAQAESHVLSHQCTFW